jgi:hypothetical protein
MRSSLWSASSVSLCLLAAACSSSTAAPGNTPDGSPSNDAQVGDGSSADGAGDTGATEAGSASDGGVGGSGSLAGMYGNAAIAPIVAAYWIGMPDNANETGGGPFVYLFSGPVACADISAASGWVTSIPAGTQVTELLIGTTTIGTAVPAAAHAAPGALEANYAAGGSTTETRATSGSATLTAYAKDSAVDGTLDVTFPMGSAKGTFHAVWCATGHEF